ncbi:TonB-dependent receptor [Spongiibacter sp. KMU-166]|uniref:TonB-dependent receptor n=1 Tax=Spongiibacter thalassae TaxID=2721624 RepID=A0ABX1GC40_9GAMM|nr:TonB-dependent receptor [Spongiibacter thalassae]NKI16530.1 TonB-dependent receptor [Spongiibacter thalassae]
MKPFQPKALCLAIASLIPLSTLTSQASAAGFALEEVIVTARKKEETLQDVPVAVTSMSADDLVALNLSQTSELGSFTPGLYIEQTPAQGGSTSKVTLRGQVQTDSLITLDPSVGWYIDDVYLARAYGTTNSMFDLTQVEVLKGPQGTLYGRNTTGGAIKLNTAKADPFGEVEGFLSATHGNYDTRRYGGAINLPLISEKLAIRLAGQIDQKNDGHGRVVVYKRDDSAALPQPLNILNDYNQNVDSVEEVGTRDNDLIRLGVTLEATDSLRLLFSYEDNSSILTSPSRNLSQEDPWAGDASTTPAFLPLGRRDNQGYYDAELNAINISYSDTITSAFTVEYDITDSIQAKLVYGYRETDTAFNSDIDGTSVPLATFEGLFEQFAEQESVEAQLGGLAFDGGLDWIAGLYFFEETGFDESKAGGILSNAGGNLYNLNRGDAVNKSQSAFVSGTLMLSEELSATLGVRATEDEKSLLVTNYYARLATGDVGPDRSNPDGTSNNCGMDRNSPPPNANFENCTWQGSDTYNFISWTASVDWRLTDDAMLYLKNASSSRSGGQNARGGTEDSAKPFDPETATDIELGLKSTWLDNSLRVNAAYYHTFYEDIQQTILTQVVSGSDVRLATQVYNAAEADLDGVEMDVEWVISPSLMLAVTGAYLTWEFEEGSFILPSAPELEGSARLNYLVPLEGGELMFDVNVTSRSKSLSNAVNGQDDIDKFDAATAQSVTLLGARVSFAMHDYGVNVAVWGRNLEDKEYATTAQLVQVDAGTTAGLGASTGNNVALANAPLGEPRTFGLDIRYDF